MSYQLNQLKYSRKSTRYPHENISKYDLVNVYRIILAVSYYLNQITVPHIYFCVLILNLFLPIQPPGVSGIVVGIVVVLGKVVVDPLEVVVDPLAAELVASEELPHVPGSGDVAPMQSSSPLNTIDTAKGGVSPSNVKLKAKGKDAPASIAPSQLLLDRVHTHPLPDTSAFGVFRDERGASTERMTIQDVIEVAGLKSIVAEKKSPF